MKRILSGTLVLALLCLLTQFACAETEGFLARDNSRSAKQALQETLQLPADIQQIFFAAMQVRTGLTKEQFVERIQAGQVEHRSCSCFDLFTARIQDKRIDWWRKVKENEKAAWIPDVRGVWIPVFIPACGNPVESGFRLKNIAKETTSVAVAATSETTTECTFCGCVPIGPAQHEYDRGDSIHYRIGHVIIEESEDNDVDVFWPMRCFN